MILKKLLKVAEISNISSCDGIEITNITDRADDVNSESLFVAIEGNTVDGHRFLDQAIESKAAAIAVSTEKKNILGKLDSYNGSVIVTPNTRKFLSRVLSRFYHVSLNLPPLKICGITGTNGKTTICFLLDNILAIKGKKVGKFTTTKFDTGKVKGDSVMTTPDVFTLQSGLRDMKKSGCDIAILELSSHGIDQYRIDPSQVNVAVLTNITQDHLDYHGDFNNYIAAKRKLFESLDRDSFAILNKDDEVFEKFKSVTPARIITYGIEKKSDFTAFDIKTDIAGSKFKLIYPDGKIIVNTSLIGIYNVYNVLGAICAAFVFDIKPEEIIQTIEKFQSVPGRLQEVTKGNDLFKVFIDYAHTPDALEKMLISLKSHCKGNLILVFGCGGDRDKKKRPIMGKIASLYSDFFIITDDNPRNEVAKKIVYDIRQGIPFDNGSFDVILDREKAINEAIKKADKGDIVVIAGKGHEEYQIIHNKRIYSNDAVIATEALKSRI